MELEIMLIPAEEGGYTVTCPILKGCKGLMLIPAHPHQDYDER